LTDKEATWHHLLEHGDVVIAWNSKEGEFIPTIYRTKYCLKMIRTCGINWDKTTTPNIEEMYSGIPVMLGDLVLGNGYEYLWGHKLNPLEPNTSTTSLEVIVEDRLNA
jgi:hypothetical protein